MKFTYYNQTVDLFSEEYFPDGPPKRIVVNCSGGLDSSALLYLVSKYFPEVEKHIFTGDDIYAPYDAMNAREVVQWIQNNVDGHNVLTHDLIKYDDRSHEILDEIKEMVDKDPSYYEKYPWIDLGDEEMSWRSFLGKIAKPTLNFRNTKKVMEKYGCSRYIAAMTQNPPNKDMEELGFSHLAETKRNEGREDVHVFNKIGISYHPFARVNKLFVKGVFEEHDLMGDYYSLTGSCTGGFNVTDWFTKPCGKCFWCHEKKWAFGKL